MFPRGRAVSKATQQRRKREKEEGWAYFLQWCFLAEKRPNFTAHPSPSHTSASPSGFHRSFERPAYRSCSIITTTDGPADSSSGAKDDEEKPEVLSNEYEPDATAGSRWAKLGDGGEGVRTEDDDSEGDESADRCRDVCSSRLSDGDDDEDGVGDAK